MPHTFTLGPTSHGCIPHPVSDAASARAKAPSADHSRHGHRHDTRVSSEVRAMERALSDILSNSSMQQTPWSLSTSAPLSSTISRVSGSCNHQGTRVLKLLAIAGC